MISAAILALALSHQPAAALDAGTYSGNRAQLLQMAPAECGADEVTSDQCVATDDDDGDV